METFILVCLLVSLLGVLTSPIGDVVTGGSLDGDKWAHHRSPTPNIIGNGIENLGRFTLKALPNPALMKDNPETDNVTQASMIEAVKFMRKFGYVPKGDEKADFIFSAETLKEKLKIVQKFGAIPQTGELDEATVKLMGTPRCGVHDVEPEEGNRRRKRFILGSSGWNKRIITYTIGNWSPKLTSKESVQKELSKAFDAWSKYSHLQFQEASTNDADIIIFFAEYSHYDNYPFDGEGGILAHAYYPYEFGSYGGDIHFDESEKWTINPKDEYSGLDFFTVAVHEIGHTLGLAHSNVPSSIMFPYYKGVELNFVLDYDDIMGLWELYIKRRLAGDDEYFNRTTTTTTTTTTAPSYDGTQNDGFDTVEGTGNKDGHNGKETNDTTDNYDDNDDDVRYHGDYETVDEHEDRQKGSTDEDLPTLPPLFPEDNDRRREDDESERRRREDERRRRQEEEEDRRRWDEERRRQEEEITRREAEERRQWEEEEEKRREYKPQTTTPNPTTTLAPIPDICNGNFDSVASIRDEIFIFKGKYMWRYQRKGVLLPGYPSAIHNMFAGLPYYMKKIDAVYERRNDSRIVFFIGKYFYVHDGNQILEGSPRSLTAYGIPEAVTQIDAAFFWPKNERTYLFRRNLYWRRDDFTDSIDGNYPRSIQKWNGLPQDLDAAVTDDDGVSYFFKDKKVWKYDNTNIKPTNDSPKDVGRTWSGC